MNFEVPREKPIARPIGAIDTYRMHEPRSVRPSPATETRLVLMCGLQGAGKTTVARRLAERLGAVRFAPDQWMTRMGFDAYDAEARQRIERLQWELAQEILSKGRSVTLESGFWNRADREEKRVWARHLDIGVELHFLDVPIDQLWERLERRREQDSSPGFPVARDDLVLWAEEFEAPDEAELSRFDPPTDTGKRSPAGAAPDLDEFYGEYPGVEDEFNAELTVSLDPRGPDRLYDVIGGLGLPSAATAVDVGCGEGDHTLELARRFGFKVHGVDPVDAHRDVANVALREETAEVRRRVRFRRGTAEALPLADDSVDLVWCREVLYHVPSLERTFTEFRRVLKENGRVVVYQLFATGWLEPREAAWLWEKAKVITENADRTVMETAFASAGLRIVREMELGSEPIEWAEEKTGKASRELRAAARLLRDPQRYIDRFGAVAYDIKLADSLWHVYRMIGKLSNRIYVLAAQRGATR